MFKIEIIKLESNEKCDNCKSLFEINKYRNMIMKSCKKCGMKAITYIENDPGILKKISKKLKIKKAISLIVLLCYPLFYIGIFISFA